MNGICDVDHSVVITVSGFVTGHRASVKEISERDDNVTDVEVTVTVDVSSYEWSGLTLVRDTVGIGICRTVCDIAAIDNAIGVAVFA